MDYTCLSPFLPKYRKKALHDFKDMLDHRAAEKTKKHAQYCHQMRRTFVPIPGTTLGSTGGKEYWDIMDAAWARVMRKDPHGTASQSATRVYRQQLGGLLH